METSNAHILSEMVWLLSIDHQSPQLWPAKTFWQGVVMKNNRPQRVCLWLRVSTDTKGQDPALQRADLELLAEVPLNVVCFRSNPGALGEDRLNQINRQLGAALLEDGRVFVGTTTYRGKVGLRPAIVNWRTRRGDIDILVEAVRELGAGITREMGAS